MAMREPTSDASKTRKLMIEVFDCVLQMIIGKTMLTKFRKAHDNVIKQSTNHIQEETQRIAAEHKINLES